QHTLGGAHDRKILRVRSAGDRNGAGRRDRKRPGRVERSASKIRGVLRCCFACREPCQKHVKLTGNLALVSILCGRAWCRGRPEHPKTPLRVEPYIREGEEPRITSQLLQVFKREVEPCDPKRPGAIACVPFKDGRRR